MDFDTGRSQPFGVSMAVNALGQVLWQNLLMAPLGSLTKRELDLNLLGAAIESGLLAPRPEVVAAQFRISLARADQHR